MQNEDTPSEVNPFFAIAERMSKPPSSPTMPTDNPFMDLAPSVSTVSQPPAIGSLSAVAGINPDQAAEATKLGTPLGIGQDLALRNMDELRRRSMVASVQRSGMLQNNPRLAQSLLDPVFAAQAHDDLDSLNATSNLFYKVASGIFETRAALLGGWERGFGTVERGELQSRKIFGSATPLDVARLEYLEKRLGDMPPGGVVSMTAEVVAQQLATARSVGTTALIGAAGGAAFGGGVPGAVAGFLSFGAAGLMATTTQTEAGNLYGDMVAEGVDPDTARYAALTGGLLNGIIELAGAKIAAAPFKALASKLMKDAVSSAIAKPTTRAAMAIAGKEYAKQVGTETAEEIGQELVAITSEELAKAFDGVDSEMSLKKAMSRIVDAGIAGFQGSLVLGGIGPTANFVVDVKRADAVAKQQEFFDGLDAAKRDGKLPKRNLDAYEGFLARQAKGTTADTVYVEAEAAAQVLAQSGLSVTELEKVLPGIREQLQNALENGGDITIPTAVYGAKLSGTQLGDALRPHMRLSPEAMSVAQAQEFSRKRDALRQEAQAALAERQEADAAFVESAQKVETTVAEQLRQTGMQDIEVRANAELFRDLAVTQAARMGITPEQFYERYPYRVRGPQAVQGGRVPEAAAVETPIGDEQINLIQTEMAPATVQVQQAIDAKAIDEKQGKQAKDSLRRISRAIENKNAGELAAAVYTAKTRNIPQLAKVIAAADKTLASLSVEVVDPVGMEYLEGTTELEVVAFEPYQEGQTNEATHVVRTLQPIVRQNGQIIQRGQVVVREGSPQYLARQEQVQEAKKAEMRARLVGAQQPLEQAARIDADYLDAVERGDMETAQRMVDEAARASGYTIPVYHFTRSDEPFTSFDLARMQSGPGIWLTSSPEGWYGRRMDLYLNPGKIKNVKSQFDRTWREGELSIEGILEGDLETISQQNINTLRNTKDYDSTFYVATRPEQVKSADPVVYDEAGNVVPLSRRFDITSPKVFEQAAMFEQAPVSPGFYSALAKSVDAIDAKSLAPSGWKERIKGLVNKGEVKQDEVDWSGLTDWLDMQEGKVTKEAVAEFLKNNGVRVERVQLGKTFSGLVKELTTEYDRADAEFQAAKEARRLASEGADDVALNAAEDRFIQARRARAEVSNRLSEAETAANTPSGETKFGQYTLPGGTNYREVLITLPQIDRVIAETAETLLKRGWKVEQTYDELYDVTNAFIYDEKGNRVTAVSNRRGRYSDADLLREQAVLRRQRQQRVSKQQTYKSPHWNDPNVLVHFRLNDRVDAEGKRVLFVEEIQSDWGQAGRKKGFKGRMTVAQIQEAADQDRRRFYSGMGDMSQEEWSALSERVRQWDEQENAAKFAVPLAPFVETTDGWLNLGLKHILLEATQGNYDLVAFVNGEQSAKRYNLSKQVREISWTGYDSRGATKLVTITPLQGNLIEIPIDDRGVAVSTGSQFDGKPLDEILPKEIAEQVMAERSGDIRGDNLKIGGKGMLEFYDKIVPAAITKLLKKYGGEKLGAIATPVPIKTLKTGQFNFQNQEDADAFFNQLDILGFRQLGAPLTWRKFDRPGVGFASVDAETYAIFSRTAAEFGGIEQIKKVERIESVPQQQPSFTVTPEMVKKLESGLPLFQAARAPRGDFDPSKLMTTLREGRDFSTFAHETAHFYLTILADIARSATGPEQTKADMDALLSWFGIEGATPAERLAKWSSLTIDQQRQYHEQFAYSFEIYLHEGKAPSVEMQSLFNQFAAWLKRVYKSIRDELNATYKAQFGRDLPMMNSEIRLVMDRMLATDEQIARAQAVRGMKVMFQTQEQSGMPDAEWAALKILEQEATDAATAELTKATLKELQWYGNAQSKYLREMQSKHDRARKEIREEVSAQVQLEPVYRAMELLKRGVVRSDTGETATAAGISKLDLATVKAIMPADFDPASLKYGKYGMVQEGGLHPDIVADVYGFGSGVELINALLAAKPIKDEINARTDQRMLDENSDLATPEARQAAVDMAIHNDFRARIIAVEQRWLEKSTRPVNDMLQAARQVAQDIIGDVVIRTLNPRRYEAAEAEAARTATTAYREPQDRVTAGRAAETRAYNEAIAAGQTPFEATVTSTQAGVEASVKATERLEEFRATYGGREPAEVARRAKRQQLVQNQLAREAMLAREEIAAAGRDFRKFFRSDEKLAKTRDMAPIMAARAILSYYGYGKRGESPAQYLDQLRTYAPELYDQIAPIVLKSLSGTADYRDLTVTEFRVLRDTVQALWAQARRDRQITVEGERVALDVVLKELTDRLETIGVGERVGQRQAPGPIDRANRTLLTAAALATRVETWADTLDGIGGPGPFTKYLVRPVLQAVDRFKVARNNYVKRFVDLLNTLELPVGKIAAPELNYTFGNGNGGIGKAELLGALMHTGNESNYRKLLLGRGWGELDADGNLDDSKWRSFVNRMIAEGKLTKADYDFVQSIWDLLEEIKPIAQRAHFEMYGYYFKEIEATEVVTPFGTYRGGYVPAATDKFMVQDARVKDGIDELEADWRNSLPSTGAGFTKSRVAGYNEALSLDLSVIASHTDSVLRFSIIQPAVKDANKLLTNREFKALLARFNPVAYESMLKPWLIRTARQQAAMPGMFKALDRGLNGLRKRAALSIFVGNFRNAISNATGWFPASLKVQPRNLKSAFLVYMGDRGGTTKTITELSPFMAEVLQSQMFELQTTMNDILLNPSKYQKLQQWSEQHGLFAQRAVQNVVSIVTWLAKFNQTIVEMKKQGASEAEAQTEAVAQADSAVRQTQGSQTPESISAFEFGTPFYRTFTQFGGWGNTMANLNAGEWVKTVRDLGWRSGKSRLIYIYLMGVMVPAMVEDAIKRTFNSDWDPEDDETYLDVFLDWFFGSQARYVAGLIPFGGAITTALTAGFTDNTWDDRMLTSPSISVLEASTVGTSKAVVAIFDEDKDITGRNVRDVLTMLTTFTGIPVSALGRPAGYLIDVERGEIEPESTYDMIRGMITGTATPESKR
jgi:hypothetical protein